MPGSFLSKFKSPGKQEAYIMNGGVHHAPAPPVNSEYRASSGTVTTTMSIEDPDPLHDADASQIKFLPNSQRPSRRRACLSSWNTKEKYLFLLCSILFLICVVSLAILTLHSPSHQSTNSNVCLTKDCVDTAAQLMSGMDFHAEPCHDFYQYACGTWNRRHVIPDEKSSFTTFENHFGELQRVMRVLLEKPSNPEECSATVKSKVLYQSCMNTSDVDDKVLQSVKDIANDLGGWPILDDNWSAASFVLEDVLAKIRSRYNNAYIFSSRVSADDKNSSINIIQLDQPSFGMPSKEYYVLPVHDIHRDAYKRFMLDTVRLLGGNGPNVDKQVNDIIDFETKLSKVTIPSEQRSDTGALYMKMTVREFQTYIPKFDVLRYLRGFIKADLTQDEPIVLLALSYIKKADQIIENSDKRTVANYLIWRLLSNVAPQASTPFKEAFRRYQQVMKGISREQTRWKKCVEYVCNHMGMAVGAMFIEDHFKRKSLESTMEMIRFLREAFIELLDENEWMDEKTKKFAKEKAMAIHEHIGYPEFITDPVQLEERYKSLQFLPDDFFHNILQLKSFGASSMMKKLREPIRKDVWEQLVVTVNAFYNPNTNAIVFPAGILQPIFYSESYPKSLNFGGIGNVIGHEITHGFDDKGRQYDKDGNIKDWWDNHTIQAFNRQTQCIIDQYSNFKLEQINHYVNGKITQGENIADNGGLKQSFRAYRKWVAIHGEEQPLPGIGLNHNQLFFLNYARIWCGKVRDEEALRKIRTSVHSPSPIRLLGTLSNSKDFAEAFNCPVGSRMNPKKKCSVW